MTACPKPEKRAPRPRKRIRVRRPCGTKRREAKAAGDLTQEEWARICAFYEVNGTVMCAYECGNRATQQEHVVPLGRKRNPGRHTASNIVVSCEPCNLRKGLSVWPVPRPHPLMEPR